MDVVSPPPQMNVVPPPPQMYDASKYSANRWCLGGGNPDKLPDDYGYCLDWSHPDSIAEEDELAVRKELQWSLRGPHPAQQGGPAMWRNMPFNKEKWQWGWTSREQLPAEYSFTDWYTPGAMKSEAVLAEKYQIPCSLRGPPNGPTAGGPQCRGVA